VGKQETNVTDKTPSEPADLVDVFYADLVRPLGNLVILYAQAEAALLELWVALTGCKEKEAQKFLEEPPLKVQEQIAARAKQPTSLITSKSFPRGSKKRVISTETRGIDLYTTNGMLVCSMAVPKRELADCRERAPM
jgi:hypothetical protein